MSVGIHDSPENNKSMNFINFFKKIHDSPENKQKFSVFSGESRIPRTPSGMGVSEGCRVKIGSCYPKTSRISAFFPVVRESDANAEKVLSATQPSEVTEFFL
jgi:proline racemase